MSRQLSSLLGCLLCVGIFFAAVAPTVQAHPAAPRSHLSGTITVNVVDAATGKPGKPILFQADQQLRHGAGCVSADHLQVGHTLTASDGRSYRIVSLIRNRTATPTGKAIVLHPAGLPTFDIGKIEARLAAYPIPAPDQSLSKLKVGDMISCRDRATGKTAAKQIIHASHRTVPEMLVIGVADAKTGSGMRLIVCDPSKQFSIGNHQVPASRLAIGTTIVSRAGPKQVVIGVAHRHKLGGFLVYDVRVGDPKPIEVASLNLHGLLKFHSKQEPSLRLSQAVLASYEAQSQPSSGGAAYAYNADGLRVSKTIGGQTTSYTWDETAPIPVLIEENDTAGNTTNYLYGDESDGPIAIVRNGTTYFPL